jgi:hypothetical protein
MSRNAKTFDKTYDYKEIAAKSADVVFKIELTRGEVGFVYKIANSWSPNTIYEIYIDGKVFMTLERQLASLTEPERFNPPIIFHRYVTFFGINNSAAAVIFEVACDGLIYNDNQGD